MKEIIFVCGVSGTGKSTLLPHLATLLSEKRYAVHEFDERGVPEQADDAWRKREVIRWLEHARRTSATTGLITVVCGFVQPKDFGIMSKEIGLTIQCLVLDATPDVIRERLTQRYAVDGVIDPEETVGDLTIPELIDHTLKLRAQVLADFRALHCQVVDTSTFPPEKVARLVLEQT